MNEAMMVKAKEAKSVTELMELAKSENIELTEEKAQEFFTRLHAEGELGDDELDDVSGGGCAEAAPKYKTGDIVVLAGNRRCTYSGPSVCSGSLFKVLRDLEFGRGYEIACTTCYTMQIVTDSDIAGRIN